MKTVYERWIDANQKLTKCYSAFPADKYNKLAAAEADAVCLTEKKAVLSFLEDGSITFPAILKERLASTGVSAPQHWTWISCIW